MAGRPGLPIGTYGNIAVTNVGPSKYKARARYRDRDGTVRPVARYGQTKSDATQRLRAALGDRQHDKGVGIRRTTTVRELGDLWLAEVKSSPRATNTKETYEYAVTKCIAPVMGGVRIGEATTGVCDEALQKIARDTGPSAAKTSRSVLNGMFGLAIRHDVIDSNPVREVQAIHVPKKAAKALDSADIEFLSDSLRVDHRALYLDVPDLIEFGLATGCRIGEALAIRETALDLAAGTVEINATVVRVKGRGLVIQERPKTAAGWRVLALPDHAVAMLRRRQGEVRLNAGVVQLMDPDENIRREKLWVAFPAPLAKGLRDPSNTAGDLRETLDRIGCPDCEGRGWHAKIKPKKAKQPGRWKPDGVELTWHEACEHEAPPFEWASFHTFRKSVATRLDDAGLSARMIADQLGHAQPSMTLDKYMGRKVVSAQAAKVLDR